MVDVRITLSGLWIAVMLTFLLGDVLRIFAGDITPGEIAGKPVTQGMWLLIAAIMLTPIIMVVLSLVLPYPAIPWTCIVVAAIWVVFNLAGLPYPGAYDNFLIAVKSRLLCTDRLVRVDVAGSGLAPGRSAGVSGKPASPTSGSSRLGRSEARPARRRSVAPGSSSARRWTDGF